jgi:RNA polymerase sigma-70 factor (ECF subfamily)
MALRHEKRDQIATLLAGLAPDSRGAVIMRYWYDLSYEEIAAATGTTVSAVKSRLHRARLSLGQRLQAGPGPDDLRRAPSYLAPAVPPGLSA